MKGASRCSEESEKVDATESLGRAARAFGEFFVKVATEAAV